MLGDRVREVEWYEAMCTTVEFYIVHDEIRTTGLFLDGFMR